MATFLDVTGLQHFTSVFVFLFVWIVIYALLVWSKVLGQIQFVNVLVGLLFGIFVLISPTATSVVASVAPLLGVSFVLIMLANVASKMLGGDIGDFPALKGISFVIVMLIVVVGAAVKIRENVNVPSETQTDMSSTINLIFHPNFLGMILIFAIAVFTIALLASRSH